MTFNETSSLTSTSRPKARSTLQLGRPPRPLTRALHPSSTPPHTLVVLVSIGSAHVPVPFLRSIEHGATAHEDAFATESYSNFIVCAYLFSCRNGYYPDCDAEKT